MSSIIDEQLNGVGKGYKHHTKRFDIPVPGAKYLYTAWVRGDGMGGGSNLDEYDDAMKCLQGHFDLQVFSIGGTGTKGWRYLSKKMTFRPDATKLAMVPVAQGKEGARILYDNVQLSLYKGSGYAAFVAQDAAKASPVPLLCDNMVRSENGYEWTEKNLAGVADRRANFTCAIALVDPKDAEHTVVGKCFGRIAEEPSGAEGFGYDPLFIPDGHEKSFAELTADEKNAISHRGRALAEAVKCLNVQNVRMFDLVHIHGIWSWKLHKVAVMCRKAGVPYVIAPRGMLEPWSLKQKGLKKKIARWLYQDRDLKLAAALHATAESEADQFRKLGFKNKIIVSPNGVNVPEGKLFDCSDCSNVRMIQILKSYERFVYRRSGRIRA